MFDPNKMPTEEKGIDLAKYNGGVVEQEGTFYTTEGTRLEERDGELFLAEGDDVGTRVMRNNEETIPSGY